MQDCTGQSPYNRILQSKTSVLPRLRNPASHKHFPKCISWNSHITRGLCATCWRNAGYFTPSWQLPVSIISIFKALRSPAVEKNMLPNLRTNGSLLLITPIYIPNPVWEFYLGRSQRLCMSPGPGPLPGILAVFWHSSGALWGVRQVCVMNEEGTFLSLGGFSSLFERVGQRGVQLGRLTRGERGVCCVPGLLQRQETPVGSPAFGKLIVLTDITVKGLHKWLLNHMCLVLQRRCSQLHNVWFSQGSVSVEVTSREGGRMRTN